ncbi:MULTISPECIES: HisA/HisF-related TIM barrel protein [unclassified Aureimonas]|uniref:HisA/HisF-related TIM barrel protein n=1 Tax=unclassified Aureimonas TaxID=2615206 RepID=UPI0006F67998|nr:MULTISPECIES: HisA/HisF-related TIM barrel protein [unclassified Aureimonas]KQT69995.1 nickel transporter [Aureimonas sp. Leaf427]KQT75850.1 nickel transporter [Aureimonas sp. Leaf460]
MQIIPVLDLMGGLVVRGHLGDRASYRPIVTPLSDTPDPVAVAQGLQSLGPFSAIYVADLDAIEGRGVQAGVLDALSGAFPGTDFWIDAGVADADGARALLARERTVVVIGSETLLSVDVLEALAGEDRWALSLDYRGTSFVGPKGVLERPDLWPARVIAMTLAKVGSGAGPDFARLAEVRALAGPERQVFAAGGVRDGADLARLEAEGISGALVASALHDGRLRR